MASSTITQLLLTACVVVLGVMTSLVSSASIVEKDGGPLGGGFESFGPVKPMMSFKDMDPIDACLFACNMCYKSEMMLDCANMICMRALPSGKPLGSLWANTCPGLYTVFRR